MAPMQQPTRGRNAWQDPSSAQPGFDAFKASAPSSQPAWQNPATAQPGWDVYKGASPQQPASQPNMSAYGQPSFRRDETVYSPFGNFQNLGQYQQQQDAFVQQFLQSQNQYNQGLNQGQDMSPVQLGDAWKQAGENIANGTYQGNPFATGNVQALMGMFDQYGIPAPAGFQDQLIGMIGQQSPPSMYQPPSPPMTGFPIGPQGEYWPGGPGPQPTAPPQGQVWPGGTPYFDERAGQRVVGPVSDWGFQPFIEPQQTPAQQQQAAKLQRQAEEAATRLRYEQQAKEMQSRYPWLDPVRRPGQTSGKVIGWQPNPGRVAEAERQEAQERLENGWIRGPVNARGEQTWVSPQQQAVRAARGIGLPPPTPVRPVGSASEAPERSQGTPYTPPSASAQQPAEKSREETVQRAREFMATLERQKQEARAAREEENRRGAEAYRIEREQRGQRQRETQERLRQALAGTLEEQPTVRSVGSAYPTPSPSYGTPYSPPAVAEQPKPLPAALGSSGPGWRESGGVRRYDPYTDPTGTGAVGAMGPNHVAPGWKVSPITGQLLYDPYTDPVATGGGPAYSPSVPDGRTWGPGTPRTPLISREPGRTQGRARSRIVGF